MNSSLRVTFADGEANVFLDLGSTYMSIEDALQTFTVIEASVGAELCIILDLWSNPSSLVDNKLISQRTCEDVLAAPLDLLIEWARIALQGRRAT